ncbi:porin [Chitinibacter sp. FCG-7]|uniref:Porin n=1 Tax=Chitinibacter mangrovi TaxID=3153927 RepID=A0AAU7FA34_9NEIS
MKSKLTMIAASLLLAAQAGAAEQALNNKQLQEQIEALQNSVKALQQQLDRQVAATPAAEKIDIEQLATKEELQGLTTDLENYKYQVQRDRDTKTALATRNLVIGGTVQARVSYNDLAVNNAVTDNRKSSFDVPTAVLTFTGNLYKDYEEGRNLSYALRFGYSPQSNATQLLDTSNFNLLDANLTYQLLPTLAADEGRLALTFGQQLVPFGLEAAATEDLKPVINNAQFVGRYGFAQRQIGIGLTGDLLPEVDYGYNYRAPLIKYVVGLVNGNGPNKSDNNNKKDFIGRIALTAPAEYNSWWRELTLGASLYKGTNTLFVAGSKVGDGVKDRFGLDLSYNHHPFGVTYEYIRGTDTVASGTVLNPVKTKVDSRAQTATLFYNFGEQFVKGYRSQARFDDWWPVSYQPFYRYDEFDANTAKSNDKTIINTVGLNVFFAETTKFQLNYNRREDQATNTKSNEYLAQFQYGF